MHERLPAGSGRDRLEQRLGTLISAPLDFARPLWRVHVLEDPDEGRTVLVFRVHHCMADGFALLHVMDRLTDALPNEPLRPLTEVVAPPPRAASRSRDEGDQPEQALA